MKIYAFQGIRYSQPAGAELRCAAPPFDQIDDSLRARLHGSSPHHFSHLTRPLPADGLDAHHNAAALHDRWLDEAVVAADAEPSLYPYAIELADGSVRRGLSCLVSVAPGTESDLRPHEETVDKPLQDRLGLLRAMRVDLEPVLLLAEDEDGAFEGMLQEDLRGGDSLAYYCDPQTGDRHILHRLSSQQRIAAYRELLRSRFAAIADGHHRTKVAQLFARETKAVEGTPGATKLAVLSSLASPDLRIDPIHRAVMCDFDERSLASIDATRTPTGSDDGASIAAAVASAPQPAMGVWLHGGSPEVWSLPFTGGEASNPTAVFLHRVVLLRAGLSAEAARDGSISYRSDPEELARMMRQGEARAGFWLPPMEPAQFAAVTARHELLPPKSTRFLPKLASGLVWSAHTRRLG